MSIHFRPYQIVPGHPIRITIEHEDGGRALLEGIVARVTDVATPSTVMRMEVSRARVTPLPAK